MTFLILIYLLRKIDFVEVWRLVVESNNTYFFLAFLSYGASFLVFNTRSMYSIRNIVKPTYWFLMKTTLAGFFVNTITPGAQLGGDPVRAYFLGAKYGKPKTKIFGALTADRFFHVIASLFFIIVSILFILTYVPVSSELKTVFQAVLFFIFLFLATLFYMSFRKTNFNIELFLERIKKLFFWRKIRKGKKSKLEKILIENFGHFAKTFRTIVRDKKIIFVGITFSLLYWILNFAVSYFLFLSFGVQISFLLVVAVFSLGNIVGDFSPSPGGIGLIEGIMIIAYSILGVNLTVAVAVSLLTRIIFYFFSIFLGGISLVNLENHVSELNN